MTVCIFYTLCFCTLLCSIAYLPSPNPKRRCSGEEGSPQLVPSPADTGILRDAEGGRMARKAVPGPQTPCQHLQLLHLLGHPIS